MITVPLKSKCAVGSNLLVWPNTSGLCDEESHVVLNITGPIACEVEFIVLLDLWWCQAASLDEFITTFQPLCFPFF